MKRLWHLFSSKSPLQDGVIWASESAIAAMGFTLVWVALHVVLVMGIATGKLGWITLRSDSVFYWIRTVTISLGLIGIDLLFLYAFIQTRKKKGPKRSEGTPSKPPSSKPDQVSGVPLK